MKNYSRLSYEELRAKLINGELQHEYMSEYDYELLFDSVSELDDSIDIILEFCIAGLKRFGFYKELDNIQIDIAALAKSSENSDRKSLLEQLEKKNYVQRNKHILNKSCDKLPYEDLRNMALYGLLEHEQMTEFAYERLLECESELDSPSEIILAFCIAGLRRFDKYKDYEEIDFYTEFVTKNLERNKIERKVLSVFYNGKPRLRKPVRIAVLPVLVIAVIVLVAFGYFTDFGRAFLNVPPDKTPTDFNGNEVIRSDDIRIYDSINEMLETENLNILYPAKLPNEYCFTNFEFIDNHNQLIAVAYSSEPHIEFRVLIGAGVQIEHFDYETNGINYNILERDGMYQAEWIDGADYYSIVVSDRAIISEIIENLIRWER